MKTLPRFIIGAAALVSIILATPALAVVSMSWTTIGNVNNLADPSNGRGTVDHAYKIGTYEVTNAQYVEFLNAKGASNSAGIYCSGIAGYDTGMAGYGITRSGSSGSYTYSVTSGYANRPVVFVTWFDAARFCNWMHNGQGSGSMETGAYTLNGATSGVIMVNPGATVYIPSLNEWYKAAYYNGATSTYSLYPNGRNTITPADANYINTALGGPTDVGYGTASSYGTHGQGGNAREWNDGVAGSERGLRGGSWDGQDSFLASSISPASDPSAEYRTVGFRVVSVPERRPLVTTGAASAITAVSANLQGTVNPNGLTTTAQFEYGLTPSYGSTAGATLSPDNGMSTQDASASISGLLPGQTYHYRLTATNGSGTTMGADITFATDHVLTIGTPHGTVPGPGHYAHNTTAILTATPDPGYVFTGWTGSASGNANPLSVLMDADKAITANFTPDTNDNDGDGLTNYQEIVEYGTDPNVADTDGDGLTDGWEVGLGRFSIVAGTFTWAQARAVAHARRGELACFPTEARWKAAMESLGAGATDNFVGLWIGASDAAKEGVWTWVNGEPFTFSNWATTRPSTAPGNTLDYAEVSGGGGAELGKWYDRTVTFTRDGYILEIGFATDPTKADTDSDGLKDGEEVNLYHTNPILADTDGDGFLDGAEVEFGGDPLSAASVPGFKARTASSQTAGTIEFRFLSEQGRSYTVEASADLATWATVETGIAGTGAVIQRPYSTENQPQRYFRVRRN
ncbi:MAG: SUMF1/EgtB/PvdO family nonheme iron enzyme [Verrucomicrobia bacterium]|nr:SUMF1/EgtB/PvdO family nonheme iron enzyme [Verrucomicrobiota bacterium]